MRYSSNADVVALLEAAETEDTAEDAGDEDDKKD